MYNEAKKPRTKRKNLYNMPLSRKHKLMSTHLSRELREKYKIRSIPVRKGDTVLVVKGSYKGKEGKVAKVSIKKAKLSIEEITISKADNTKVSYYISPSNCIITKLNLTDKRRKINSEAIANE